MSTDTAASAQQVTAEVTQPAATTTRDVFIVCNSATEMGGLTRWAHQIAALLSERGHRVRMIGITPPAVHHDYGDDLPYPVTTLYERHPRPGMGRRTPRKLVNPRVTTRELRRRREMRAAANHLSQTFATAQPGGIIIVTQIWAMEWVALANTHHMPIIGMSHESHEAATSSSRATRMKRLYTTIDRLILLTREDADAWTTEGLNNCDAIPNPAPLHPHTPSTRTTNTVVALGRLSFEKGYDMLLDAWHTITPHHPDWTLKIYGTGPEEAALHTQAAELGITDTVEFPGQTGDVEGALRDAAIFAMPSRAEGFPLSALEAMAMALPTIAFDSAPGIREILTHNIDALLVTPGNVDQYATTLTQLINDKQLRDHLGDTAAGNLDRYEPDAIIDRWERTFDLLYR